MPPPPAPGADGWSRSARALEREPHEAAWAPSFRTHEEAQAFRERMERRFDPDTLVRLDRGEAGALAAVAPDRLDGLGLARRGSTAGASPSARTRA